MPVTFYLYVRDMWKIDDVWPAWGFALVMSLYLAHGQDPFVLALALTMGGLALLARRRPLWAALPVAVGIFSNPLGLVVVVPFMLTDFIVRPAARRRYLLFAAALAPAVVVRFGLGLAFSEPGSYLNETSQLMVFLGFALVGLALAGVNAVHPRRPFVVLFLVYAVCLRRVVRHARQPAGQQHRALLHGLRAAAAPAAAPHAAAAAVPLRRARRSSPSCCSRCCSSAPRPATSSTRWSGRRPRARTSRRRWRPPRDLYDPDYRFHVVALRRHWEALYFPEAGYPITRGWYRQADAIHNGLFYTPYDAAEYVAWLQSMGVQYIFSPVEGPLDPWSRREARLLEQLPGLRLRRADRRLAHLPAAGRASRCSSRSRESPAAGTGDVLARSVTSASSSACREPGTYWLKVTSSPYWVLEGGPGTVHPRPDRFMDLRLATAGTVHAALRGHAGQGARRRRRRLGL